MLEWREGYVSGGTTRFFVRALGHGDDLVICLHGWPETSLSWHRVAPILVDAGWRVACPDLKGFGRSDAPRRGYDPQTLADEISQLVRNLHVRKAVVVGHDWGGAVALATAFRHPGRVRALVVADSPYRHLDLRRAWHIPLLNLPVLPEVAFRTQARRLVTAALRYGTTVGEAFPDEVVDEYVEAVRTRPRGWLTYYRTMPRSAVRAALTDKLRSVAPGLSAPRPPHRLRVPVRVVWGEHDPVLPLDLARRTAEDLGGDLDVIEATGHFPHEEDPRAFAGAVLGFLETA